MSGDKDHECRWTTFTTPDMLICRDCKTVSRLSDVLYNTRVQAEKLARVRVVSSFLFDRELKKEAHDREYNWVMRQNGAVDPLRNDQLSLIG